MAARAKNDGMHFAVMQQVDVPNGRNGKHKQFVTTILSDLDQLETGAALRVPLPQLTDSKEKIRSALNRASRKLGRRVATASDGNFLYIWNETPPARPRK